MAPSFQYQWTAPNGLLVGVQQVAFPDGNRQVVGLLYGSNAPPVVTPGSGLITISAPVMGPSTGRADSAPVQLDFGDTASRYDAKLSGGYVMFFYGGGPTYAKAGQTVAWTTPTGKQQLTNVLQNNLYSWGPGWYGKSQTVLTGQDGQNQLTAYQWAVQQLASMSATASSVANPNTGSTAAQNVPPPAPGTAPASSGWSKWLLLAGVAAGGYFLLKPSSSSSSSAAA